MTPSDRMRLILQWVQIILGLAVALMLPFLGWVGLTIINHGERITSLENQVTGKDLPERVTILEQTRIPETRIDLLFETMHRLEVELVKVRTRLEESHGTD